VTRGIHPSLFKYSFPLLCLSRWQLSLWALKVLCHLQTNNAPQQHQMLSHHLPSQLAACRTGDSRTGDSRTGDSRTASGLGIEAVTYNHVAVFLSFFFSLFLFPSVSSRSRSAHSMHICAFTGFSLAQLAACGLFPSLPH